MDACGWITNEMYSVNKLFIIIRITSVQIASTEKYALDIEDLSLFYQDKLLIQAELEGGEYFSCNLSLRCSMDTFGP